MTQYVLAEGVAPLPGIGPGPLSEEEYLAREAAYLAAFEAPEGEPQRTPRDNGIYVARPGEAPRRRSFQEVLAARAAAKAEAEAEGVAGERPAKKSRTRTAPAAQDVEQPAETPAEQE